MNEMIICEVYDKINFRLPSFWFNILYRLSILRDARELLTFLDSSVNQW